jgi:protein-disulfide isomerase
MTKNLLLTIVLGTSIPGCLFAPAAFSQSDGEMATLRQEIETLKQGQDAMRKDLQEIKQLLTRTEPGPDADVDITVGVGNLPVKGDESARVTLVEFSDYQCPYCQRHVNNTVPQLAKEYIETGKLRYAFRDFPIQSLHPKAFMAHMAARCAGDEGQYWALHQRIFSNPRAIALEQLVGHAEALDLDVAAFQACLDVEKYADQIRVDMAEGERLGVSGTPTFFLGVTGSDGKLQKAKLIRGAQPYNVFKAEIDKLLAE